MLPTNGKLTKDKILNACEEVYAVNGIEGLSLRHITERADVNLAAVNYHFRTKEVLLIAMLKRHLAPLHAERMALLTKIEAAFPRDLRPTHIVAALLLPTINILKAPHLPPHFASFALRCASDPATLVRKAMEEAFHAPSARVNAAFVSSSKHMDPTEAMWRAKVFFNNFPGTVINQNTLSMLLDMLRATDASVFDVIVQFGSVMECVMHRLADKEALHALTADALDILETTPTLYSLSSRMLIVPENEAASPFPN